MWLARVVSAVALADYGLGNGVLRNVNGGGGPHDGVVVGLQFVN